jgi:hypothetical protein
MGIANVREDDIVGRIGVGFEMIVCGEGCWLEEGRRKAALRFM